MMTGFGMGFGWVFMLVFWIAIIAAAVWLLGNLFPRDHINRPSGGASATAVDILKQRYASGELTQEEFESMRRDINS